MTAQELDGIFTPEFQTNPHPTYEQMRAAGPVQKIVLPIPGSDGMEAWLVTRYAEARQALRDPNLIKGGTTTLTGDDSVGLEADELAAANENMLSADPPDHTRLRRLVMAAFTSRRIEQMRPRIQEITDELLDAMAGSDPVDLVQAFAFPLPIRVICELLGVPRSDQQAFRDWSTTIVAGVNSGEQLPIAMREINAYIRDLIADKRANPTDDLLSALIQVREEGDRLTENELTSTVFLLLIAGNETTVNLIGTSVYLLLSERERWEQLRADPSLLPTAVEEFLRYESPVMTGTFRVAAAPVEIGGTTIPAGSPVLVSLMSANRDSRHFPDAEKMDLSRKDNQHLAFGHGIHHCLGAPLARMEAQVALRSLMDRYPDLQLAVSADSVGRQPGLLMRGLTELPVTGT